MGLEPWGQLELEGRDGQAVTVTAVPAQHGPDGSDAIQGPVIGFVLSASGAERVYVSGDNASLDVVRAISERVGDIPIAVFFAGAVQLARKFDGAYLTLSSDHVGRCREDPGRPGGRARALRRVDPLRSERRGAAGRLRGQRDIGSADPARPGRTGHPLTVDPAVSPA